MDHNLIRESSTTSYRANWDVDHIDKGVVINMHSAMFKDEIIHNRIFDPYMLQVGRAYYIKSDTNKFRNKNGGEYAFLVKYTKDKLIFLTVRDKDGINQPFFVAINIEDEQEWEIDRLFKE